MSTKLPPGPANVVQSAGRLWLHVPWSGAEAWQAHCRSRGIRSTLELDPGVREARLELWTNYSAQALREMLGMTQSTALTGHT